MPCVLQNWAGPLTGLTGSAEAAVVAKVLETWGPCGVLASLSQMELFLSHDFSCGDKQQLSLGCSPSHCLFICCEGLWCWCSAIFLGKGRYLMSNL